MEMYEKLVNLVMNLEHDVKKFYEKGNNAAGTRARKALMEIREFAQQFRVTIQDTKNSK